MYIKKKSAFNNDSVYIIYFIFYFEIEILECEIA
jgi:hypothetical protein